MKMQLPVKLLIGSLSAFVFIVLMGFILFPKILTGKVKSMVNLAPGTDIREMFLNVPFPLSFKIYMFNVTNPMEVQSGAKPIVREVGPFCYEEWKTKVNVEDMEADDIIVYNPVDTFIKRKGVKGCRSGKEMVTIPHPMILGVVNTVARKKPGALSLVNKALKSIYRDPTSIFLTATADDILFDGVIIDCDVKDFAGKAICSQLKEAPSLKHISESELSFSLFSPKNGTEGKQFQALRGTKNFHDVGRIIKYDGAKTMNDWPTKECNVIKGTDGTIFPPFLEKEEGLISFSPDLCRSLAAYFVEDTKYDGIPVRKYSADLGDQSTNEAEKCYCYTPDTCLKKGLMDLYQCSGVPIVASLPHFYNCHESYIKGVQGLRPNQSEHEIVILFEAITGGPVSAKKRLQFSMPLETIEKVDLFKNFSKTILPLFWVEEGVDLNKTFTKPIKQLFTMKKVVKVSSWLILLASLGGMGAAGYLFYKKSDKADITPVQKVKSEISMVHGDHDNPAMSNNEIDKY